MDLFAHLPTWAGTVPGWITAVASTGGFGLLLRWHLGNRKLANDATAIANADEADIRDHYAEEVKQLRESLRSQGQRHRDEIEAIKKNHREEMERSEDRHEACVRDREALRDELRDLKDELAGVRRMVASQSASIATRLGDIEKTPASLEAAQRLLSGETLPPLDPPAES